MATETILETSPRSQAVLCPHPHRKHYSRGLCASCYQMRYVSTTRITACPHVDEPHRGRGMCKSCYMAWYFAERAKRGKLKKPRLLVTECSHTDRPHSGKGLCRTCYTAWWRRENPSKARAQVRSSTLRAYGLSLEQYSALWKSQGGKCANPGCTERFPLDCIGTSNDNILHVDHCHQSGAVRGLLCKRCNAALGQIDDDVPRLLGLVEYLRSYAS